MAELDFQNTLNAKFPKIYRFFTDRNFIKTLRLQGLVFIFSFLITVILITVFDLVLNAQKNKEQTFQRKVLMSQLNTWESISQKFPNFKEAYYQMAVLSYRLGDFDKAKYYVDRALLLDPNFEKAKKLQNLLGG